MYGTVARMRLKAGAEPRIVELFGQYEKLNVPGYLGLTVYRLDEDSDELLMAVVFESKDAYRANAESPEQDARYREMLELLESEPQWQDGEIVYRS